MYEIELTRKEFDKIPDGDIFRVVIARIYSSNSPSKTFKYVCVKGTINWAIYFGDSEDSYQDIRLRGDKVIHEKSIKSICPCSQEMLKLYRF